jgi:hypothetical protein
MAPPANNPRIRRGAAVLACGCLIWTTWKALQQPSPVQTQRVAHALPRVEQSVSTVPLAIADQPQGYAGVSRPVPRTSEGPAVPAGPTAQGWVVDALGGPIAGATVTARSTPGGPAAATAISAADGRFTLGAASRSIELCAELDGYSSDCIHTAAPSDDNTLRLLPASTIVGRVVLAEGGAPVPGATVEATSLVGARNPSRSSRSDAEGAFSISALPAGSYLLAAVSPTARSREERVVVGIAETSEPVVLFSTRAVQVSAEVLVANSPCRSGRLRLSGHFFFEAEVSSDGHAVISGVYPGRYAAVVTCEGGITPLPTPLDVGDDPVQRVWNLEPLPRAARPDSEVDSNLATLVVHVGLEGDAPEDLQVFAHARGLAPERARREGARFVFDALPLGEYRVYAQDRLEEAASVQLTQAGEAVALELPLTPGARIFGVVVDERDAPVADAWVSSTRTDAPVAYQLEPVLTDLDGRFSLLGAQGVPYRVTVSSAAGDAVVDGVQTGNVTVRVVQPASVAGSVWAPERQRVPQFTVQLARKHGTEQHEIPGADSRFFVPTLEPGEYELKVRSALGGATRELVVAPGQELALEVILDGALQ